MFMFAVLRTMCVWVSIMIAVEEWEEEEAVAQVIPCGPLLQLADSATHQQWLWSEPTRPTD